MKEKVVATVKSEGPALAANAAKVRTKIKSKVAETSASASQRVAPGCEG